MLHSTNTKHKPKKRARKRAIDEITIQESQDMVTTWQRAVEDVNEYPDADYDRMVDQLNKIKAERLVRAKLLRDTQRKLVVNWFAAQTEQAKNDFQYARYKARNEFIHLIQKQISSLNTELNELQSKSNSSQDT
ncbi:hypothetical protein J3Q64DRAFT_1826484 [Phycomyces blakesleeanus]|uniref:Homeodomain-like DNA binding domain-containing transcription factor n=1 Tax=Phycomyces blakesleeanus TaxID=4837 RepID=A0ABR3AKR8_PHYBL